MRFTLIDAEGSTVDTFDGYPEARDAVQRLLRSDSSLADELLVTEYSEGIPTGAPRSAGEFVSAKTDSVVLEGLRRIPTPTVEIAAPAKFQANFVRSVRTMPFKAVKGVAVRGIFRHMGTTQSGRY